METLGEFEATLSVLGKALKSSAGQENLPDYAGLHYWFGHTYGNLGRYDEARRYLHRSLELSQKSGNIEFLGYTNDYLGQLDFLQGYLSSGFEHLESAVRYLQEIGNSIRLAWSFTFKTLAFCHLNEPSSWSAAIKKAEDINEKTGNDRAVCLLYIAKCGNLIRTGQYKESLNIFQKGLELAEKIGEGIQIPFLLRLGALAALLNGQSDYALQLARKGEEISEKVGHPLGHNLIRITKALIMLRSGMVEDSIAPARAALKFCRELDLGIYLCEALELNAEILANSSPADEQKIDELLEQSKSLVERIASPWFRIYNLLSRARIYIKLKRSTAAADCLGKARSLYSRLGLENGTDELGLIENMLGEQAIVDR
jgi:tetratricopeptide (TPR) repeat protein